MFRLFLTVVTNKPDKVADSGVLPCGISDHDLIYIIGHWDRINVDSDGINIKN